jgi:hypothetical protein
MIMMTPSMLSIHLDLERFMIASCMCLQVEGQWRLQKMVQMDYQNKDFCLLYHQISLPISDKFLYCPTVQSFGNQQIISQTETMNYSKKTTRKIVVTNSLSYLKPIKSRCRQKGRGKRKWNG